MRVIVHRGTREIGGSCVEVATTKTRLIVDLGMPLVAPWNKAEKLETIGYVKKSSKELLDLGVLEARLTIRFGSMIVIATGILLAAKFLG